MAMSDAESVRNAARDILSRPEFGNPNDREWWERILEYLEDPLETLGTVISWVLARILGSDSTSGAAWVIVGIAAAFLIWLVVKLTRAIGADGRTEIRLAPETHEVSGADLLKQASICAAAGEWREAIRLRYAACLVDLAARGLVDRRPGKTTGEYAMEVETRAPVAAPTFHSITTMFEWVWYGGGSPDATEYRALEATISGLRSEVAA